MSRDVLKAEAHPLKRYGVRRAWGYEKTAEFFAIPISTYKQLVTGHTGASFARAEAWERLTDGEVTALDVMRWQERNRKHGRDAGSGEAA